jgi:hypothetical protein
MKTLVIGIGEQLDICNAFNAIGSIIYFDWTKHEKHFNGSIRYLVDTHKPDLVFMQIQTPGIISVETAKYISSKSIVVSWTGDVRFPTPEWMLEIGKHIHLTLFTNMYDVEVCRKAGINADYLQIGFPDKIFTPDGPVKENCPDIIFMGNNIGGFPLSDMRSKMVKELKARYGSNFGCYGINWGSGIVPVNDQHVEASYYRGCKIAINLSHFNYSRYSSDRLLRAMGAGAFVLSHNYIDIDRDYLEKIHLGVWNDFDDLFCQIDYYLKHNEERNAVAKSGWALVHGNEKWSDRISRLRLMLINN